MLTDLLEELAREAPTGGAPPGQLWRRGRRMARTRRVGTVAIAAVACVLLIALGSVTWQQRAVEPPVADTETKTYVPARIYTPSPFLPGTDEQGPPGVLIATIEAEREGWVDRGRGLVGVSATTGDYRFLDLPDANPEYLGDAALSPDGRHVAYWITGSVPDPLPERPKVPSSSAFSELPPIVGYAVYDTVTGKVGRRVQSTQHGLGSQAFVWFDPGHLAVTYGQMRDCCSATPNRTLVHDLASGTASALSVDVTMASTNGRGTLIDGSADTERRTGTSTLIGADGSTRSVRTRTSDASRTSGSMFAVLSPDATKVAFLTGSSTPDTVELVGIEDGTTRTIDLQSLGVVAWLDATHLAAYAERPDDEAHLDLLSVDVRDGSTTTFVRNADEARFAINLLDSPVRDQPDPPEPWSPWRITGTAAAVVAGAAIAILVWRRRVGR
ncbi:hypothetical protein [Nocardioides luteus]|uniref:hypothetical protein n=1 Tax=Nocardioides luteus TaxID=1844 RepID=UPI000AE5BBE1|nr:hypothetical protein [Nocardioides luteus]